MTTYSKTTVIITQITTGGHLCHAKYAYASAHKTGREKKVFWNIVLLKMLAGHLLYHYSLVNPKKIKLKIYKKTLHGYYY